MVGVDIENPDYLSTLLLHTEILNECIDSKDTEQRFVLWHRIQPYHANEII